MGLTTTLKGGGNTALAGATLLFVTLFFGCVSVQPIPTEKTVLIPATKMRTLINGQVKSDFIILQAFKYRTIEPYYVQQIWKETDLGSLRDGEWYADGFMCGEFSTAFMDYLNRRQATLKGPRWAIGVIYLTRHTQICFLDTLLQLWLLEPQNGEVGRMVRGAKVKAMIF